MYDTIIIGAGCAGLAAAMYAGRLNMKTILIGDNIGGTIALTDVVENLIFIVKVFLKRLIGSLIPKVYEMLIPIAEFYYVYSIIGFIYRKAIQRRRKA